VLTFRPTRFLSDLRAELELRELLRGLRERHSSQISRALDTLDWLQQNGILHSPSQRGGSAESAQ